MKPKKVKMSGGMKAKLQASVRANRRETIYKMSAKRNGGKVPCFVCGQHVSEETATLEHIIPKSKGGTDEMDNLSISHYQCNQRRGNGES